MPLPPSFRRVVVDDTDISFTYGDSWVLESSAAIDAAVTTGPAFDHTLHQTSANTTFSVDFTGSDIVVSITVTPTLVNNVVLNLPQWECIVDGTSLGPPTSFDPSITAPRNNLGVCENSLGDGNHQLVVKVTTTEAAPFWIDDIQYTPSSGADLSNATLKVYNLDPDITYSSDFVTGSLSMKLTQTTGGTAAFDFWGKSVTWVGYVFAEFANISSSTASYTIDAGAPTSFNLSTPSDGTSHGNAVFFTSPDLPPGPHTLVVTHHGNAESMPLVLDYLFVSNTTVSGDTPGEASSTTTANNVGSGKPASATTGGGGSSALPATATAATAASLPSGQSRAESIAGWVVGGVILVAIISVGYFIWRRAKGRMMIDKSDRSYEWQDGAA